MCQAERARVASPSQTPGTGSPRASPVRGGTSHVLLLCGSTGGSWELTPGLPGSRPLRPVACPSCLVPSGCDKPQLWGTPLLGQ